MDNAPDALGNAPPVHVVEADGCFGSISWSVSDTLYSIMPRSERDELLDGLTCDRVIVPFFDKTTRRLLDQVACKQPIESLNRDSSLEVLELTCCFGKLVWSISQGLWDALPQDQRGNLLELALGHIHIFFRERVLSPLLAYSSGKLMQ